MPVLSDSGYEGARKGVHVPVKKPRKGELDDDAKTRNAPLRGLRYQGKRAIALMNRRWTALQRVTADPGQIDDIAKAALVLTQVEHGPLVVAPAGRVRRDPRPQAR